MTLYPRRRFYRFLIYVIAIVLVLTAIDLVLVQMRRKITPGFDTTRITAPVMEDGTIDYLTAIEAEYSRGVTDDNNAAPLLLEAFGRIALSKDQPPDGITGRLHMRHLPEEGDYLISLEDFQKAQDPKADLVDLNIEQWPPSSDPRIAQWIQQSEKPLEKIRQATLRPRYFVPMIAGNRPKILFEVLLPHLNKMRNAARGLAGHALLRAQAGDFDSARADLLAMHRLVRLTAQGPTLIERLVSIGLEKMACSTDRNIARHAKLDSASANAFLADSLALSELPPITHNIDTERFLGLDFCQHCAQVGPVETGRLYMAVSVGEHGSNVPAQLFRFIPIPFADSMRAQNSGYDALIVACSKPTYAERKDAILAMRNWYEAKSSGFATIASRYWLLQLIVPSIGRAQDQFETATAELRLTKIAWALAAYRVDQGAYPESLELLRTQYLSAIPPDNFIDAPFHYQRRDDGYQLYSVGPNMIDDKGSTTKPADDVDASNPHS